MHAARALEYHGGTGSAFDNTLDLLQLGIFAEMEVVKLTNLKRRYVLIAPFFPSFSRSATLMLQHYPSVMLKRLHMHIICYGKHA